MCQQYEYIHLSITNILFLDARMQYPCISQTGFWGLTYRLSASSWLFSFSACDFHFSASAHAISSSFKSPPPAPQELIVVLPVLLDPLATNPRAFRGTLNLGGDLRPWSKDSRPFSEFAADDPARGTFSKFSSHASHFSP
jgi:hypothetical protein